MFTNSRNIQINGGQYNVHNNSSPTSLKVGGADLGLDILRQNVAFGASHDSGERFDPPKCDPDTRLIIIQNIMDWVNDSEQSSSMLWLLGSAGVGKSSLAQTIAELCRKMRCLAGSFFFCRTALDRSDGRLLISTLSYQLTSTFPAARSIIQKTVNLDPLVLQLSLEGQMQKLFTEPINRVARSPIRRYLTHYTPSHPRLVVIDGLDECSDPTVQCEILRVLSSTLQSLRFPFRFLIASRPEVHIIRTFTELNPNISLTKIDLAEHGLQTDSDIRTFLIKQFKKIKETHPLQLYLPFAWPADEKVDELVRKSSRQFIYASVAMRYIACPKNRPNERLDIVLGLCPCPTKDVPFAQLDELYTHILSSIDNIDVVLKILGILFIPRTKKYHVSKYLTPKMLDTLLNLQPGDVELHLNDLQSVITIDSPNKPIRVLHASLADFLLDLSRAGPRFYVNIGASHAILAGEFMRAVTRKHKSTDSDWDPIIAHLKKAVLTESLHQDLLGFPFLTIFDRVKSVSVAKPSNPNDTRKSEIAGYIWRWITAFLSCFDHQSLLFDRRASEEIYTQLLLHLDSYLKRQLAHCIVDDELMDLLTFVTSTVASHTSRVQAELSHSRVPSLLYLENANDQDPPSWYPNKLLWDADEIVLNIVLILSGFMRYSKFYATTGRRNFGWWVTAAQPIREKTLAPLRQFLLDPERSGEYFVDGKKYAHTALRCLKQLYHPRAISVVSLYEEQIAVLCITTEILLSKAAATQELVAFFNENAATSNHSLLKPNVRHNGRVDRLVAEIQAYLKRANNSIEYAMLDQSEVSDCH